ncbi:putative late blight resistance protein homolog R1A-3 [Solanum tuberosum]|nr:PREDICTED: putative late blight resistance protein homolog R1A-3 [Solanum tuberosum]
MDTTKKQVMDILSHDADQVLELSGDSLIATSSTSYPMMKDDIVYGLDDDLEIIINRYHFDILAWVTISQEFSHRSVLLEALHCISKSTVSFHTKDYDKMDDNELADLVQKNLKGRRYLIVVDDIWSTDVWDSIIGIFPNYNNGNRILLTTRKNEVAMYANTCSPHEMKLLSLENGWRLLCDKVFGPNHDHPPELEGIGKEIVEKCQGLPLTISVIAGHLSKVARTLESWKDVAQTLSEIIASQSDKYLGVLGFPKNGKSLEEVAIDYLEDLISRNLIQARKRGFNGDIKACGIHDILREFCLIEAEMTKHMHVERTYPTLPTQKHNVRRFSFQTKSCSVEDFYKLLTPVARSIYLYSLWNLPLDPRIKIFWRIPSYRCDPNIIPEFFSRFNLLRVLVIFNKVLMLSSFPVVITKLFHLRYLQVPFHQNIPESISELQNLQTLICSGYSLESVSLPVEIWTMQYLRYIHLRAATSLPSPRRESILNKHLVTRMPNLEEFSGLSCTSCTNEVFSGIPDLRRLIIQAPLFFDDSLPNGLMDMSILRKLETFKCYYWQHSWISCNSIKSFVFPTSLKRLTLTRCYLFPWEDISSTLIMLPNLEEFKLKDSKATDDIWRLSDEDKFKSLKLLLLDVLNLKHWESSSDNFPNLKRLVLKNCTDLQEIPGDFGEIGTLESIELHDCSTTTEDSAREIVQEQEDMGNNILKVYIHNNCRE